jgi:prepilin-type processing-associated H-X9-DG protein
MFENNDLMPNVENDWMLSVLERSLPPHPCPWEEGLLDWLGGFFGGCLLSPALSSRGGEEEDSASGRFTGAKREPGSGRSLPEPICGFGKEKFHIARGDSMAKNFLYADGHIKNLLAIEGTISTNP